MLPVRVGISSCLLGEKVRHDGGHKLAGAILECLGPRVEWVPVCPELEVGMGVPREPVKLVQPGATAGAPAPRMLGQKSGKDWTEAMRSFARQKVKALQALNLSGYILKSRSPSCGLDVPLFDSRQAPLPLPGRAERGLFAAALCEGLPFLPVEEENRLVERPACEGFLRRVLDYHRRLCERIPARC